MTQGLPGPGRRALLFGGGEARPGAAIGRSCLAFAGVACMACRDACETGAVRFTLVRGGALPRIEADLCTACGACVAPCPAGAITVTPPEAAHA